MLLTRSFFPQLDFYRSMIREDGPIEYFTVIMYLMSFVISILLARSFRKERKFFVVFTIFSIGFLLISMEEISWGQRIFNFNNPSWFPHNVQNETNLHNLAILMPYQHGAIMAVSIYGILGWIVFPKIQKTFQIFGKKTYRTILQIIIPSRYLIGYFIPIFITLLLFDLRYSPITKINLGIKFIMYETEPFELLMAVGIFIFLFQSYIQRKNAGKTVC